MRVIVLRRRDSYVYWISKRTAARAWFHVPPAKPLSKHLFIMQAYYEEPRPIDAALLYLLLAYYAYPPPCSYYALYHLRRRDNTISKVPIFKIFINIIWMMRLLEHTLIMMECHDLCQLYNNADVYWAECWSMSPSLLLVIFPLKWRCRFIIYHWGLLPFQIQHLFCYMLRKFILRRHAFFDICH